jgi:dienelactone hydrolase
MMNLVRTFDSLLLRLRPTHFYLFALLTTTVSTRVGSAFLLVPSPDRGACGFARLAMSSSSADGDWSPLNPESLCAAPCLIEQTLCLEPNADADHDHDGSGPSVSPRLALDKSYASAVLDAWRHEEEEAAADHEASSPWTAEYKRVVYCGYDPAQPLFGYLVRKQPQTGGGADSPNSELPGVLLFHTAAGPNDVFLMYKAAALASTLEGGGCVVLVADLLSDGTGWGWRTDKTRYKTQSRQVLQRVNGSGRLVLQDRIEAAIRCLTTDKDVRVDPHRQAALGWCFGGHAIQELGLMAVSNKYSIRAMVTFHGVFDNAAGLAPPSPVQAEPRACEVLICTGTDDPFVSSDMVETALQGLQDTRHTVSLLQLRGARHGFSNPGQLHNANQKAFGYDGDASRKSWRQTMALLHRRLVHRP